MRIKFFFFNARTYYYKEILAQTYYVTFLVHNEKNTFSFTTKKNYDYYSSSNMYA